MGLLSILGIDRNLGGDALVGTKAGLNLPEEAPTSTITPIVAPQIRGFFKLHDNAAPDPITGSAEALNKGKNRLKGHPIDKGRIPTVEAVADSLSDVLESRQNVGKRLRIIEIATSTDE